MYKDSGHRPHAKHTGETPENKIVEAPYHLKVTLDTWGPSYNLFPSLYDALQSNWGDEPSRLVDQGRHYTHAAPDWPADMQRMALTTGWVDLTPEQRAYVETCFAGETLPQVLERITFSFLIDGATRAATHQIVRTRLGAAFMQHGGRDNDWRHRPWVMPETIRRAIKAHDYEGEPEETNQAHCITDWKPINDLLSEFPYVDLSLRNCIEQYLEDGRGIYAALVDAGIPWEDARRLLWIGTSTYIHADYNYLGLRGVMANRLEHIMDWEINCIMQLARREIVMHCPPVFAKYLVSGSDRAGKAMMAGLQSWPPDGKYPNPFERCGVCGHAAANHENYPDSSKETRQFCEACERNPEVGHTSSVHTYTGVDTLPREHRPEQNPFWVLHPDSMAGGPIVWVPTNGTYPHEVLNKESR